MVTWRPEDPGGHMPYCVHPEAHSPARFCAADLGEPETMQGKPSRAWHRDHPAAADDVTADPPFVVLVTGLGNKTYGPFPTRGAAAEWAREHYPDVASAIRGLIAPEED